MHTDRQTYSKPYISELRCSFQPDTKAQPTVLGRKTAKHISINETLPRSRTHPCHPIPTPPPESRSPAGRKRSGLPSGSQSFSPSSRPAGCPFTYKTALQYSEATRVYHVSRVRSFSAT